MRLLPIFLFVTAFSVGCAELDDESPNTDPVDDSGKGDGPSDLVAPSCGGTEVHTSTIADRRLYAPNVNQPTTLLTTLGKGWTGSVSFELGAFSCADVNGGQHYTQFIVEDGNGQHFSLIGGYESFANLKLPVKISAPGVSGGGFYGHLCAPSATVKQIRFTTIGTSCLPARVARPRFTTYSSEKLFTIGEDTHPTMMTFSAKAQFYANYTAPECAKIILAGGADWVVLTAAHPATAGLAQLRSPISVYAYPTCQSSRLQPPEATDADFKLTMSPVALGVPLSPI
jgi:hypothetical protein